MLIFFIIYFESSFSTTSCTNSYGFIAYIFYANNQALNKIFWPAKDMGVPRHFLPSSKNTFVKGALKAWKTEIKFLRC